MKKVPHREVVRYYAVADVFTLASKDGLFGIVYLESMASNLPVVAPDDESGRSILGKAGEYFSSRRFIEYSEVLQEVVRKQFGQNPRKQAEKYSWDVVGKQYRQLIHILVSA